MQTSYIFLYKCNWNQKWNKIISIHILNELTCSIIPDIKKEKARMYARTHTIKHADLGLDASFSNKF